MSHGPFGSVHVLVYLQNDSFIEFFIRFTHWDMCCDVCCGQQIMSVGGNGRARQFFKQHGWSELGADKIEQKVRLPASFILLL